jgi:hypothetical protein
MLDLITAKREALRRNIERYSRLLTTNLTNEERGKLHRRLAEDWAVLSKLNSTADCAGDDEPPVVQQNGPPLLWQRFPILRDEVSLGTPGPQVSVAPDCPSAKLTGLALIGPRTAAGSSRSNDRAV